MPCFPGFWPVTSPVHETLEMVGMDDRIGAAVPRARSARRFGMTPRAARSSTSGRPTPSRPITATRDADRAPARSWRPGRRRSSRPSLDLLLRHAHDLGDRRDARADLLPAVLPERPHALLHRRVPDDVRGGALEDQLADGVAHEQQLVDPRAAAIAGLRAVLAAAAFPDLRLAAVRGRDLAERLGAELGGLPALEADLPHEPLREDAEQRGREQVVLDAHLEEPGHGAGGIVRVERREDE